MAVEESTKDKIDFSEGKFNSPGTIDTDSLPNYDKDKFGDQFDKTVVPNRDISDYLRIKDEYRSVLVHLSLDKPVYRPGDVMIMEAFAVDAITKTPALLDVTKSSLLEFYEAEAFIYTPNRIKVVLSS